MEMYETDDFSDSITKLGKSLNHHNEIYNIDLPHESFVAMPESIYFSLLERLAKCDKELQNQIIISLGDQISGWEYDTASTFHTAEELGISTELVNAVVGMLPDIFRDYDGFTDALFSPYGWLCYKELKEQVI